MYCRLSHIIPDGHTVSCLTVLLIISGLMTVPQTVSVMWEAPPGGSPELLPALPDSLNIFLLAPSPYFTWTPYAIGFLQ